MMIFQYKAVLNYTSFPEILPNWKCDLNDPNVNDVQDIKKPFSLIYFLKNKRLATISIEEEYGETEIKSCIINENLTYSENIFKKIKNSADRSEKYHVLENKIKEMREETRRILYLIGWYFNSHTSYNLIKKEEFILIFEDSEDNLPLIFKTKVEEHVQYDYNYGSLLNITNLLKGSYKEPLAYEFFREAVYNSETNIRSSLIIGFSALEIGTKNLISEIIPETEWLMEKTPSPPIVNIIRHYLPTLNYKSEDKYKIHSKYLRKLEKYNNQRNKLVHYGTFDMNKEELDEFLELIHDLLYLFEYYKGFDLGINHLGEKFRKSLVKI